MDHHRKELNSDSKNPYTSKPYLDAKSGVQVSFVYEAESEAKIKDDKQAPIVNNQPKEQGKILTDATGTVLSVNPIVEPVMDEASLPPIEIPDAKNNPPDEFSDPKKIPEKISPVKCNKEPIIENSAATAGILDIQLLMETDDLLDEDDENINYFDEDIILEGNQDNANVVKIPSNLSFHSLNSADCSVIQKLEVMKVYKGDNSVSNSNKRVMDEDDVDTASSEPYGGNKKKKTG